MINFKTKLLSHRLNYSSAFSVDYLSFISCKFIIYRNRKKITSTI